jgi:flavin-dependent dehydrogenase
MVTTDVIVIGAGAAGTAAARCLARAGRSVVLLDCASTAGSPIGETFPPMVNGLLGRLDLLDDLERAPHLVSHGIASAWGALEPRVQDYLRQPAGRGWHVDRRAFNALMQRGAVSAGAVLHTGLGPVLVHRPTGGMWRASSRTGARVGPVESRFLIDATGRTTALRFPKSPARIAIDRLVALVRTWSAEARLWSTMSGALIEACAEGWVSVVPQPRGSIVTAFQTDPAWLQRHHRRWDEAWTSLLARDLPETARRLSGSDALSAWRVVPAGSSTRGRFAGDGWAVAGDAATACDPLCGAGVTRALGDGIRVAEAIDRALDGDHTALAGYDARHRVEAEHYVRARHWYYAQETRWRDAPFWKARRHAAVRGRSIPALTSVDRRAEAE